MDQVTEQAGALAFSTKQAEAAIAKLREEREIAEKANASVPPRRQDKGAKSA